MFFDIKARAEDLPPVPPPRDGEHPKAGFRAALRGATLEGEGAHS